MSSESKVVRSDRFTLSITGFALITLIALIIFLGSSAQANASVSVSGMNTKQIAPLKQTRLTGTHAMSMSGDVDFDYAANFQIHQKPAHEMSPAQ